MPRYDSQNLAAIDPEFRKTHNISLSGSGSGKPRRYMFGKQNNVLVASGAQLFANGLCLRLMPIYTGPEGNVSREFANFREGRDNAVFGDWSRLLTCAFWVGNPGACFIIHDGNPEINLYESPYHVLRNVAWNNSSGSKSGVAHPTLGRLFDDLLSKAFVKDSHVGSLKKAEQILFVSASVVSAGENGMPVLDTFTDDAKRNARIIGLKTSAAQSLLSALNVRDEKTGELLSGDMLSFDTAKLVTFLPETFHGDGRNRPGVSVAGIDGVKLPKYIQQTTPVLVGYPPSRSSMTHFGVIHDTYNGHEVSLEPFAERLVAETLSWDEYMHIPSYDEQAEILAPLFPREALDFAWREFPQYLRHLPKGTTTFAGVAPSQDDTLDDAPAVAPRSSATTTIRPSGTMNPPAPWDPQEAEISVEDEAGVVAMFAAPVAAQTAPSVPPGAATAPPAAAAKPAAAPAKLNSAEILARARAARSASKK
jgi:hypothetical protein